MVNGKAEWLRALSSRLAAVRDRLGSTRAERVLSALTIACVLVGVALRLRGFLFDATAFWLDECQWAMNIMTRPLSQNWVRPIGFVAVSRVLASLFSPTELALRALPWAAGITTVLVSPAVARWLFRAPGARLLFVAVLALNPCAIDFSKEFKPYALGLLLHLSLATFAIRYARTKRPSHLAAALTTAVLGGLFTQDLIFAYPGVFLVVGWEAWRSRREHLPAVVACAFVVIGALLAQYFFIWSRMPPSESELWGNKYNVFHTASSGRSYFAWSIERFADMVSLPGYRRNSWEMDWMSVDGQQGLRAADQMIWLVMHGAGLAVLVWQRRLREALLIALPLLVLWIFNRLGMWPLGAFRTNVFTIFYATAIGATAIDWPSAERATWSSPVPALILIFLPLALFERSWNDSKSAFTYDSRFPEALSRLVAAGRPQPERFRDYLLFDRRTCYSFRYYTQFHPQGREQFAEALKARYDTECVTDDAHIPDLLREKATMRRWAWLVLHAGKPVDPDVLQGRVRGLRRVKRFDLGGHRVFAFRGRGMGRN
jgi:hypothetical protein